MTDATITQADYERAQAGYRNGDTGVYEDLRKATQESVAGILKAIDAAEAFAKEFPGIPYDAATAQSIMERGARCEVGVVIALGTVGASMVRYARRNEDYVQTKVAARRQAEADAARTETRNTIAAQLGETVKKVTLN